MVLVVRSEDAEGLYGGKTNWPRFIQGSVSVSDV